MGERGEGGEGERGEGVQGEKAEQEPRETKQISGSEEVTSESEWQQG